MPRFEEWIKKKREDIIPGDVIKDKGFVLKINLQDDFWEGKPTATIFYDLNDSYFGPYVGELTEDEYEVLENRRDLIDAHNIVDSDLAKHIADLLEYRKEFMKVHRTFFNTYNRNHPRKRDSVKDVDKDNEENL